MGKGAIAIATVPFLSLSGRCCNVACVGVAGTYALTTCSCTVQCTRMQNLYRGYAL